MAATVGAVRSKSRTRFSFHVGVAKGGGGVSEPPQGQEKSFSHRHQDSW